VPQTVTCQVLSSNTLANLTNALDLERHVARKKQEQNTEEVQNEHFECAPLVLAGLHACGDLSVNMLRFLILVSSSFLSVKVQCF
jgi:Methyltransferase domain